MTLDQADGSRSASQAQIAAHWLRKVEFERLPRVVQDRFVASTAEEFPPWPILRAHPRAPASRGWTLVTIVSLAALVMLVVVGFGDPSSRFVTRPMWVALVFTALVASALLGFFRALAARGAHDLPFRAGVYLFPSEVVDARSPTLRIHPLAELSEIDNDGRHVRVRFRDGAEFSFSVPNVAAGESAVDQVLTARDSLHRVHDAPSLLGLLDPLWEPGEELPVSSNAPFHVRWSFWVERSMAVALAGAFVLGPPAFLVRDWMSDRLAFERAVKDGTSSALGAYASHGRRHVKEVKERLLPLIALRAMRQTAAIEQWMADYPVAALTAEAKVARRDALVRDLTAITSIPSIRTFAAAHANDGLEAEIAEAFRRAHQALVARRVSSLVTEHLLTTPASCGRTVGVQIVRGVSSFRNADIEIAFSPHFGGSSSFVSTHLASQPAAELAARTVLEKRIRAAFPEGCLLVAGATTGTPVLELKWTPRYAGTLLEVKSPPAVFADLAIDVEARLVSPEGQELARLTKTYSATVRPSSLARFAKIGIRDPFDPTVERVAYQDVVTHTLEQAARDASTWFVGYEPDAPVSPL